MAIASGLWSVPPATPAGSISWGVERITGDLEDAETRSGPGSREPTGSSTARPRSATGAALEEFRRLNVEALRLLLDAACDAGLERFVHVSSLGVYEGRDHYGTDETVPPAVELARRLHAVEDRGRGPGAGLPSPVAGSRLRSSVRASSMASATAPCCPSCCSNLRRGTFAYFGSGDQVLNCIYVKNLVHGIFLAAENPGCRRRGLQPDRRPAGDQEAVRRPGRRAGGPEAPDATHPSGAGQVPCQSRGRRGQAARREEPSA